jgi:hypothetical protein
MTKAVPQRKRQTREEKLAELTRSLRATWQAWSALDHKKLGLAKRGGALLAGVKKLVGHGAWLSWLRKHLPHMDVRTAQNWQRIWLNWNTIEERAQANAKSISHLGMVEALDLIRKPRPESEVHRGSQPASTPVRGQVSGISGPASSRWDQQRHRHGAACQRGARDAGAPAECGRTRRHRRGTESRTNHRAPRGRSVYHPFS